MGTERLATGDAVNVAARLEQAAQPGEILIGEQTLRLARGAIEAEPVAPLSLKGKARPVPVHRLTSDRPYRPARSPEQALEEIRSHVGWQFCPVVFRELEREFRRPDSLLRRA